ncbi:MAG TPA: S49 family peptidase, partial [Caulobacteraceae bacterium]|nr:S49 family peptidase [Caulobacteraceae bacterium]
MKQFLLTMAGVFAGLLLFLVGVPFLLVVMAAGAAQPAAVPAGSVLELDLREDLSDQDSQNPLAAFSGGGLSVISIVETLRHAETDDKVAGVFVRLPEGGIAPAAADELRQAFRHFQAVGKKPVWVHSQGLYPSGVVTSTYMLGASASQFWMQPESAFQVTGFTSEDIFFGRAFEKYGVKTDFEQRAEYKNAVNPLIYSDYTPAHREAQMSWMTSVYRSAVLTAAADRKKEPQAFVRTLEAGPYSAREAQQAGLIDGVGQVREAMDAMKKAVDSDTPLVSFHDYRGGVKRSVGGLMNEGSAIAIVGAEGPIMTGKDEASNPFAGRQTIWS